MHQKLPTPPIPNNAHQRQTHPRDKPPQTKLKARECKREPNATGKPKHGPARRRRHRQATYTIPSYSPRQPACSKTQAAFHASPWVNEQAASTTMKTEAKAQLGTPQIATAKSRCNSDRLTSQSPSEPRAHKRVLKIQAKTNARASGYRSKPKCPEEAKATNR